MVAVAAVAATAAVPGDRGLHARYYASAAASGAHELSTDFHDPSFTRVDTRIDFARGGHDFPLGFFNDHTRFNFIGAGQPDRRYLEFAAAWTGWWWVAPGSQTLYLHAPGAPAQVAIDTLPILSADGVSPDATRDLTLAAGWHRVHITFSSPYREPREFSAGELVGGTRRPFDATVMRTERIDERQRMVARALAVVKPIADLLALGWLSVIAVLLAARRVGELWQGRVTGHRAALALFLAAAFAEAMRFAWPWG